MKKDRGMSQVDEENSWMKSLDFNVHKMILCVHMSDTSIHIRIPKVLKKAAEQVIEANGLDVSSAIRLFFVHIVNQRTIPLKFMTLNGLPPELEEELKRLSVDTKNIVGPFRSSKKLLEALYAD